VPDHNHRTNVVRRLLCLLCNTAIGMAGEDPARLRRMADYLEQYE
jgi:Recombination endonuclease VII